jgi:DNA-binding transcriptional ArsR family regulator
MKRLFNPEERRIINALYVAHKPLTTHAVAEYADMSWPTAKKYLTKLNREGYVIKRKVGKSIFWWLKV